MIASQGTKFEYREIPAELQAKAEEARAFMIEAAAEATEELMDKYLNEGELTEAEIIDGLRDAHAEGRDRAGVLRLGVQEQGRAGHARRRGRAAAVAGRPSAGHGHRRRRQGRHAAVADDKAPFSALAFKIMTDPFVGSLTFFRVYSGVLNSGDAVYNPVKSKKERVGRILQMHSNERERDQGSARRRHRRGRGSEGRHHRRHAVRAGPHHHPGAHGVPGARHLDGGRAEDQVRPGKDGHRPGPPGAGRSLVPRAYRRRIRPDHHRRHGRAAPGHPRRPHEARVQRGSQRRQAAGRLPRDHPQVGRQGGLQARQAVRR